MDTLGQLIQLVEYVSDPKKRVVELRKLDEARKAAASAVTKLAKAHGGVKMLMDAERTLRSAETKASITLSQSKLNAEQTIADATRNVGDMKAERKALTTDAAKFRKLMADEEKALQAREAAVKTREDKTTKRENDIARSRADIVAAQSALQERTQRVEHAMRK